MGLRGDMHSNMSTYCNTQRTEGSYSIPAQVDRIYKRFGLRFHTGSTKGNATLTLLIYIIEWSNNAQHSLFSRGQSLAGRAPFAAEVAWSECHTT